MKQACCSSLLQFGEPLTRLDTSFCRKLLTADLTMQAETFGYAREMFIKGYTTYQNVQLTALPPPAGQFELAYFPAAGYMERSCFLQQLSLFNRLYNSKVTMYLPPAYCHDVQGYCNSNILVVPFEAGQKYEVRVNMVITYGSGALYFLQQGIPVIIAGPYGLGGWVTPGNLPFLLRTGCMGRPGGTLNEFIPVEVLAHELGLYKDGNEPTIPGQDMAKTIAACGISPLPETIQLHRQLTGALEQAATDDTRRALLKARLCSNINIIYRHNGAMITRNTLHDTICVLEKEDAALFENLKSGLTCGEMQQLSGMAKDDFSTLLVNLVQQQVIYLEL